MICLQAWRWLEQASYHWTKGKRWKELSYANWAHDFSANELSVRFIPVPCLSVELCRTLPEKNTRRFKICMNLDISEDSCWHGDHPSDGKHGSSHMEWSPSTSQNPVIQFHYSLGRNRSVPQKIPMNENHWRKTIHHWHHTWINHHSSPIDQHWPIKCLV